MQNDNVKFKIILLLILFFGLFGLVKNSRAACNWTGNTGEPSTFTGANVQACINDAANKGGEVIISLPSGTSSAWGSTLNVNMSGWITPTKLTIQGQGINSTTINADSGVSAINVSGKLGIPWRITGIKFTGIGSRESDIFIGGLCNNWRVDNSYFYRSGATNTIWVGYYKTYGVIDHNTFEDDSGETIAVWSSADSLAKESWAEQTYPGGVQNTYIEDNTFIYTAYECALDSAVHAVTGGLGGRYVFRHNTVTVNSSICWGTIIDAHGSCWPLLTYPSTRWFEAYNNNISGVGVGEGMRWRGSDGIFFNNTISGVILVDLMGDGMYCGECGYSPDPCNTQAWPSLGQMKNGYLWNNTLNDSAADPSVNTSPNIPTFIQLNRDYYLPTSGTYANRPGTCNAPATNYVAPGYWATDQNTLYTCTAPNTWTAYYTPYTYPHPLREEADTTPPAAPAGLVVN